MTNEEIFAATAIKTWTTVTDRVEKMVSSFSDDELQLEIAPGRNRVYYLLGHLAAVHDLLLPTLSLGERLHPELDEVFLKNPDRTFPDTFSATDLRAIYKKITATVTAALEATPPADLLKKHSTVSEEDFAREPLRNRFAVLESRTSHASYHAGQIRLVK